ncbi:unnamed protein product [Nippostrongylus brasiliensis]|uniref:Uncharacterized protein n=1 Tax=Nippostrongylus brasiliensis TaxID=27835 RepID=A0A0N4Y8P7_NIPBR|nr:unnamed protein product [Nippostrongylus brasiliensis]
MVAPIESIRLEFEFQQQQPAEIQLAVVMSVVGGDGGWRSVGVSFVAGGGRVRGEGVGGRGGRQYNTS